MEELIRQDFENEIKGNFPFKEIVLSNQHYEDAIYREFKELKPRPKENLYIADKMDLQTLESELSGVNHVSGPIANFVSLGSLERKYYELQSDFSRLIPKGIDEKYQGRFINDTPIVKRLYEVENKMKLLYSYIEKYTNIDNYRKYAKTTSKVIDSLLYGIPFKNEIINEILKKDNSTILIKHQFSKYASEDLQDRYNEMIDILSGLIIKESNISVSKMKNKTSAPKTALKGSSKAKFETFQDLLKDKYKNNSADIINILRDKDKLEGGLIVLINSENEWIGNKQAAMVFIRTLRDESVIHKVANAITAEIFSKTFKGLGASFATNTPGATAMDYAPYFTKAINDITP